MSHDTQILKQSVTEADCSELCGFGQSPAQLSPFHSGPKRRCCTCTAASRPGEKTAGLNGGRAGKLGARPSLIPTGALWEASPQNPHSYPGGHHNGIQDSVTMALAVGGCFLCLQT